jgi:hypothetical protein
MSCSACGASRRVAEMPEGVAILRATQGNEEGVAVGGGGERLTAVIPAIEGVVDQAVADGSWQAPRA